VLIRRRSRGLAAFLFWGRREKTKRDGNTPTGSGQALVGEKS